MTKKKLDYLGLNKSILQAIGFDLKGSLVIDQDTMQPVIVKGKILKYSENTVTLVHSGEILFNPLKDRNLMRELFALFLSKEEIFDDLYTQMYSSEEDEDGKTRLVMITNKGTITSNPYYIDALKYIEIILSLSGINMNLVDFDDPLIREKEQKERRKQKRNGKFSL